MAWTSAALRTGQATPTQQGCCELQCVLCELCLHVCLQLTAQSTDCPAAKQ